MDACKFNVWWVGLEHGFIQDFSFGGGGGEVCYVTIGGYGGMLPLEVFEIYML